MNEKPDWYVWQEKYIRTFLTPGEKSDFVNEWKSEVLKRDLEDMTAAIIDVSLDARPEARFPRQHLRVLLEHADARFAKRNYQRPKPWGKNPHSTEAWDRQMLKLGAIDQAEFDRRDELRKAGAK